MNFIFDLGNILIEWNKETILSQIVGAEAINLFDEHIFQSGLWEELDMGHMSLEELEVVLCARLGQHYQKEIQEIIWHWPNYVLSFPDIYSLVRKLKKNGHRIYILSNTSPLFYHILGNQLNEIAAHIDGFVISCEVGSLKPAETIYVTLLEKYNLDTTACLFFDDLLENVLSAEYLGIKSFQIKNTQDLVRILNGYV